MVQFEWFSFREAMSFVLSSRIGWPAGSFAVAGWTRGAEENRVPSRLICSGVVAGWTRGAKAPLVMILRGAPKCWWGAKITKKD